MALAAQWWPLHNMSVLEWDCPWWGYRVGSHLSTASCGGVEVRMWVFGRLRHDMSVAIDMQRTAVRPPDCHVALERR